MKQRTEQEEIIAIDKALDEFMNDCRARLHDMVKRGKRGWDNPETQYNIIKDMFNDTARVLEYGDKHHLHDIANRAMIIWWQTWRIYKDNMHPLPWKHVTDNKIQTAIIDAEDALICGSLLTQSFDFSKEFKTHAHIVKTVNENSETIKPKVKT